MPGWLKKLLADSGARRWMIGALGVGGLALIALSTSKSIVIVLDGRSIAWQTHARTVAGALREAGLSIDPADLVRPSPSDGIVSGAVIEVERAHDVAVEIDGVTSTVHTTQRQAADILAEAGWPVYPGDRLWVDGLPAAAMESRRSSPPSRIRLVRARSLTVNDRGSRRTVPSAAPTVGEALWENGLPLREGDQILPGAGSGLAGPTGIAYSPALPIEIRVDGQVLTTYAPPVTVGEALARAGIGLSGLDRAEPGFQQSLPADGQIRVVRVREDVEMNQESIPFTSSFEPVTDLEIDHQQLVDEGAQGIRAERVRIRMEDGIEVSRFSEGKWVAQEPRPRVLGYGTKIVIRTLDTPDGPVEYWRAVPMYATSYSPCRLGTDYCNANLASGGTLQRGIVAVILRWYRSMRGMYVYVPGYGSGRIADTGGGIPGRFWIDLGYSDDDYVSWHYWTTVYFLTPVPPEGLITWVLE
jgi:uncharacterized protein YabE (DUF348 family)